MRRADIEDELIGLLEEMGRAQRYTDANVAEDMVRMLFQELRVPQLRKFLTRYRAAVLEAQREHADPGDVVRLT